VNIADCTVTEKILLAAHQLEQEGQSPFSAEALIVACWLKFPRTFGLKGYADLYPDSNKVLSSIMGARGLANKGWLQKMGQKLYTLSREGRGVAQRLAQGGEPVSTAAPVRISRDQEKFILGLFGSAAVEKFDEGRKPELTFADACRFWNVSETLHGEQLDSRLQRFEAQLSDIDRFLAGGDTDLSNGRNVSAEEVAHLRKIHDYLIERFARHLNLLRSRVERT
jgi:hypothetical protein